MTTEITSKVKSSNLKSHLIFHLLGVPASFLFTSYFSNFHPGYIQFIFLVLCSQILFGTGGYLILQGAYEKLSVSWRNTWASILVLIVVGTLAVSSVLISWQFPGLFNQRLVSMGESLLPAFFGLTILSTPVVLWLIGRIEKGRLPFIEEARFTRYMQRNRAGIFLAILFFLTYFTFTQSVNFPGYYTRDQYFETDISDWIKRLTASPTEEILPVRSVHPAVLLILRPLTGLLSVLMNGDKLQAAFMLSALAGSACVFMTWMIVKQRTGSMPYALISASLLGASASHLLLSSMLETYIFSALALVSFCYLLQTDRISLKSTVPMGVVIFGITITNLAQACILYFLKLPRVKVMIQFIGSVVLTAILLNVIQVRLYSFSRPLYDPSSLLSEQKYRYTLFETPGRFGGRVNQISRAILLHGMVAPDPFILTDELGVSVPNFRTFKIAAGELQVAGYKGLADVTAKIWIAILGLAIILFIFNLLKSPVQMVFPASLVLCMGFSFGLHLLYGDDPMLYSPNWVYALVLFVSVSFERWSHNKWIQAGLIVFLGLMTCINLGLLHRIMNVSLPFYGG